MRHHYYALALLNAILGASTVRALPGDAISSVTLQFAIADEREVISVADRVVSDVTESYSGSLSTLEFQITTDENATLPMSLFAGAYYKEVDFTDSISYVRCGPTHAQTYCITRILGYASLDMLGNSTNMTDVTNFTAFDDVDMYSSGYDEEIVSQFDVVVVNTRISMAEPGVFDTIANEAEYFSNSLQFVSTMQGYLEMEASSQSSFEQCELIESSMSIKMTLLDAGIQSPLTTAILTEAEDLLTSAEYDAHDAARELAHEGEHAFTAASLQLCDADRTCSGRGACAAETGVCECQNSDTQSWNGIDCETACSIDPSRGSCSRDGVKCKFPYFGITCEQVSTCHGDCAL